MRILVTGITGRVGSNLAMSLVEAGHEVRGLVWERDERTAKLEGLDVELEYGTITDMDDALRATDGVDAVYHMAAAFQGGGPFTNEEYLEINVKGTFNMLEAARAHDRVGHFIQASTDAVYGGHQVDQSGGELIREDVTLRNPHGWYALSKHLAEEMCHGYYRTYSLPVTMMRFAWVRGAGEAVDAHLFYLSHMKGRFPALERLWEGEERLIILRDQEGNSWKDHMVDVRDLVSGLTGALNQAQTFGEVYHLAGPRPFTWEEAVPHLSQALEIPWVEDSLEPAFRYELDISKARSAFGYDPQYDVSRMVDDGVAYKLGRDIGVLPT